MKLTQSQLRKIIKEELVNALKELTDLGVSQDAEDYCQEQDKLYRKTDGKEGKQYMNCIQSEQARGAGYGE